MRITTRPADPVAADAEGLARAAVTRRARAGIHACFASVIAAARAHPSGRVRIARADDGADFPIRVAIEAEAILLMTRRAESGVRARLFGVTQAEARTVETGEPRFVEREPPRKGRDGDAVALRTERLAVTCRAEIA